MKTGRYAMAPAYIAAGAIYALSVVLPMALAAVTGNAVSYFVVSSFAFAAGCAVCYHRGRYGHLTLIAVVLALMLMISRRSSAHLWRFLLTAGATVYVCWALSFAAGLLFGLGALRHERQEETS